MSKKGAVAWTLKSLSLFFILLPLTIYLIFENIPRDMSLRTERTKILNVFLCRCASILLNQHMAFLLQSSPWLFLPTVDLFDRPSRPRAAFFLSSLSTSARAFAALIICITLIQFLNAQIGKVMKAIRYG